MKENDVSLRSERKERGVGRRQSIKTKRNEPEDNVARAAGVIARVCNNAAVGIYNRYTARNDENRVVRRRREGRYTQRCARLSFAHRPNCAP